MHHVSFARVNVSVPDFVRSSSFVVVAGTGTDVDVQ
jgi:hypothetical protein